MKIRLAIVGIAVLLLPLAGQCQSGSMTAAQILDRVSQTYQHLGEYHIVASRLTTISMPNGFSPMPTEARFDLSVELPSMVRLDYKQNGELVTVSNGAVTWRYLPGKKEYTENEAAVSLSADAESASANGGQDLLAEANDLLFARYCGLARYASEATLVHAKSVKFDGRKTPCYVVKLSLPDATHTLWIDEENFLVLRHDESGKIRRGPVTMGVTQSLQVKKAVINTSFDQNLFAFTPPKGVREVDSLGLPGEGAFLVGKRAADFTLRDDDGGGRISLSDFRGKVVLLDFWATWCPPCRKELPEVAKLYASYRDKGLVVLGISQEGGGTVKHFFRKQGFAFPTLDDPGGRVSREYGANAIPDVVVIDSDGVVRAHYVGARSEHDLISALRSAGFSPSR